MDHRPILFIDVDGPLNPYDRSNNSAHRAGYMRQKIDGFRVFLNPSHGPALSALPFELVWGTTWEQSANRKIGPRIGLPELPVCGLPDLGMPPKGLYFKTPLIVEYANGRPFAWIDDEITDADRGWVAERHDGPALLHWVDPAVGLEASDFEALTVWAGKLAPAA